MNIKESAAIIIEKANESSNSERMAANIKDVKADI